MSQMSPMPFATTAVTRAGHPPGGSDSLTAVRPGHRAPAVALAALLASGCASFTPPERPAWNGSDQVGDVAPEQLVGTWNVTPLNPYPDAEPQTTVIEYRADGTVGGRIEPEGRSALAFGADTVFELSGEWRVADGIVSHENIEMEAVSESAMAQLMSNMINSMSRGIEGSANVYELDANRIVMLGEDGAAMRYERM